MRLPKFAFAEQSFPRPTAESIDSAILGPLQNGLFSSEQLRGKSIAVGVGSRGITHLEAIVRTVVVGLKAQGAKPFIFPAMGSHGGGTAEGQTKILADYGITEEKVGAPVHATMETVKVAETPDGIPVYFDRHAYESDGVIIVNRIKPHTDFQGEVESGLLKMATIGIGKRDGANAFHSRSTECAMDKMIQAISTRTLGTGKALGGLALLENAYHETAKIEWVPAAKMQSRDPELLREAKRLMPSLPVDQGDVLIVDYIGKDISGVGIDPSISGRRYRINTRFQDKPDFTRIIILDLTDETKGNASGIGLGDFTTQAAVDKMDKHSTYLNCVTSRNVIAASIPPYYGTDRETIEQCVLSVGGNKEASAMRMIRIRDTLSLERILISEALIPELKDHPQIISVGEPFELAFDEQQNTSRDIWIS